MRRFYILALLAFLFIGTTFAQTVLVVEPGVGTLNAAIAARLPPPNADSPMLVTLLGIVKFPTLPNGH